jgi:DNA-binding CsgD family transcriptional regulator/tetratricopeptide (TPR) repeat protein
VELVERAELLAQLNGLLAEARAGAGRMALISGDAGVGKTSLARAFVSGLPASVRSLWGSCDPLSAPRPLGPFRDMPTIGHLLERPRGRRDLLQALLDELAGPVTTVMVLEDVHWADEATLDALRFLGRRVDRTRGLVIATFREDDLSPRAPARGVIGDLATAPGCRRLDTPPLSMEGVAALAEGRGIEPTRLYASTGGNPFYVTEVLAAPGWAVPPTVTDAVLARLARLDEGSRRLLEVVSLAPRGLEPAIATAVADEGPEALDDCLDRGMLVLSGEFVAFRHELARLAVAESIAPTRRRRLHGRLLDELERQSIGDASRLAHHAAEAGDAERLLRYGPAAAAEASARGAHRAAAEHLGRTIEIAGAIPPRELADLLSDWAMERARFDDPGDLLDILEKVVRLRRESGDVYGEGRDLRHLSQLTRRAGDSESAGRLLSEALSVLEGLEPGPDLADCYAAQATNDVAFYRIEAALRYARLAIDLGRRLGPREAVIMALNAQSEAQTCSLESGEGIESTEAAHSLAIKEGDDESAVGSLVNGGGNLLVVRHYDAAREYLDRAISLGVAADLDYFVTFAQACVARIDFEQARWTEAERLAEELLADPEVAAIVRITAFNVKGRVLARRGDRAGIALIDEAWSLVRTSDLEFQWPVVAGRAEAAWRAGRSMEIAGLVGDVYERAARAPVRWAAGELGFWMWRAGDFRDSPENLAEPWALQVRGDWRAAAAAWDRIGCPYERAEALSDGDEPAMREALAIFSRLGAEPAADRLRERMRRSGVARVPARPRRSTRSAPAQLTRRQIEILGLLEGGLSNAEIASRLFITEKTAGHHVSAVLAKLGARSRAEAGSAARRLGITAS